MVASIKAMHADSRKDSLDATDALVRTFQSYLKRHAETQALMQARSEKLARQERDLHRERRRIMSLPWWRRAWIAIFPAPL